ncbi:oxidoreductase YetM [Actinosynnema sp. ALI-1.44]|nr:oxidoreductase YetM [Actinosynnema sp. ALI-1.44]
MVAGAGIAGLTAATALARQGWTVEIVEIRPEGATAGWGLTLTGPSLRALDSLGLADACVERGYGMTTITNVDGAAAETIDLPGLIGPGRPSMVGIARPDLHAVLRDEALRLGVRITCQAGVAAIDSRMSIKLTDGTTRHADLMIGADGIRSHVRDLLGLQATVRYHGQMVWRARVRRPTWATGIVTYAGPAMTAGVVPISHRDAYVFLTENGVAATVLPDNELPTRMRDLLGPFTGRITDLCPQIQESVVRRPVRTALIEGPWSQGRCVMIGDAAHAPCPQMASGAALAIEDGVVLAEELDIHSDVTSALAAFENRRRERCTALVKTSEEIAALEGRQRHRETYPLTAKCHSRMALPA